MSKTLTEIAEQLRDSAKKVQLIYAFNGTGKTRLSRELKRLVSLKSDTDDGDDDIQPLKVVYYNAFTEDLFYWDNDLAEDVQRRLKIQPNAYTRWVLEEQGQDQNAISHFQRYTSDKLTPRFNQEYEIVQADGTEITVPAFSEVTFSFERGNEERDENIKISKGEESNFIWSIFYSFIEQVVDTLNIAEISDRDTDRYDAVEYIFIDDPVSSLDENHIIELAVNLAALIKSSQSSVKYVLTTHNPLFYNVLCNELQNDDKNFNHKAKMFEKYRLDKKEDGFFELEKQRNDSPFSYHLYLMEEVKSAIESGQIKKYHFSFLRHILEKTSTFLGYKRWEHILPLTNEGTPDPYVGRILNLSSHSKHSGEEISNLPDEDKRVLKFLVGYLTDKYGYWKSSAEHNDRLLSKTEYERRTQLDISDPDYINPSLDHWKYE